jgi:serine/threonine-protein kinase
MALDTTTAHGPCSYPPASIPSLGRASRYELLAKLGAGGMATVYLARLRGAAGFTRLCAVKRPHRHVLESPSLRRGFLQEACLASMLHHPNVVPVIDVEEIGDEVALVMDFIEGASLADLLRGSMAPICPLPPYVAVRIALDVCSGLAAAHELTDAEGAPVGLIHRDVSPENVLVGVDGTARLADFGIAKHARSCSHTPHGALRGKLAYMAPEYIQRRTPDVRSDVFALAVLAWEILANRRLFVREGHADRHERIADTLRRIAEEPAPPLSSVAPHVGRHLDSVLAAALEKAPERRTCSARAFGQALHAAARRANLIASPAEVGAEVRARAAGPLAALRRVLRERVLADAPPSTKRPGTPAQRRGFGGVAGLVPAEPPSVDRPAPDGACSAPGAPPEDATTEPEVPQREDGRTIA